MNQTDYGIDNIESLSFKEGVRQRISMYLGTDDTDGIYQSFLLKRLSTTPLTKH